MAEVKALLKEAREAYDKKKFDVAESCCKKVLQIDKQNYMALVMVGAALGEQGEHEKALAALRRATQIDPVKPLAWQGLLTQLDKIEDSSVQLTGIITVATSVPELRDAALNRLPALLETPILPKLNIPLSDLFDMNLSQQHYKSLAHLALRLCPITEALELILSISSLDNTIKEWICYHIFNRSVSGDNFMALQVLQNQVKSLTKNIEETKPAKLLNSILFYANNDYVKAYNDVKTLINLSSDPPLEILYVLRCTFQLQQWSLVEVISKALITRISEENLLSEIRRKIFISLVKRQHWHEAYSWINYIDNNSDSDLELAAECLIETGNNADTILDTLQHNSRERLSALKEIKAGRYERAREILNALPAEASTHYLYLAMAAYHMQLYDQCLAPLLQAAKLNPDDSRTFFYLGLCYNEAGNVEKAKKCLYKAHALNKLNQNIVKELSELLMQTGEVQANYALLNEEAKKTRPGEYWVYLQLGLHYLAEREWDNAIIQLRKVIGCNDKLSSCWESLADAYFSRGSYSSALKCYERSKALGAGEHTKARAADCTRLLTGPDASIPLYEAVLKEHPYSVPATRGFAQAHLALAQRSRDVHLYGIARQHAQDALSQLMCLAKCSPHFACIWKHLGQGLLFVAKLPEKYSYVYLDHIFPKDGGDGVCQRFLDIYPTAVGCYARAMKIAGDTEKTTILYEVTTVYRSWYLSTGSDEHWRAALAGATRCVRTSPRWWRCWSLLGSILASPPSPRKPRYRSAQHAFLKAIQLNPQDAVSWANLGIIYLKLDQLVLANRALRRAQDADPSYSRSWIGQAMIAETVDQWEAMDLYRHSSVLAYHREGAGGYAEWSWKLKAPPPGPTLAEDLCTWLREEEPDCGYAATFLGGLQEKRGQLNAALQTYRSAARLIQNDKTLINLARISLKTHHAAEAVTLYKMAAEASLESTLGLALSLLRAGKLEEAYAAYESAVEWFECNGEQKGEICVALAGVAWKIGAKDQAKAILFGAGGGGASWVIGAAALALLQGDDALGRLIMTELKKHFHSHQLSYNVTYILWRLTAKLENETAALKRLIARIHMYPDSSKAWVWLHSAIGRPICWKDAARAVRLRPDNTIQWSHMTYGALTEGNLSVQRGSALVSAMRRRPGSCKPLSHWLALADRTLERCCASN